MFLNSLAWRLFMEPPVIPDNALDLLKVLSGNILHCEKAMLLLTELTLTRPKKLHYLSALLEFCSHANEEVRIYSNVPFEVEFLSTRFQRDFGKLSTYFILFALDSWKWCEKHSQIVQLWRRSGTN